MPPPAALSAGGKHPHHYGSDCDGDHSDPKWEKVLWRRQPFPDNYVPPSFLAELDELPQRPRPKLVPLILATLPVSQHLAVITLFLAIFYGMLVGSFGAEEVGWACAFMGLVAYGLWRVGWEVAHKENIGPLLPATSAIRPLLLPPLLLGLLAPVLGTLTSATTSDSIWPLAGLLFFVHLLLTDFRTGPDRRRKRRRLLRRRSSSGSHTDEPVEEKSLTSSLSLTSALSASVVLASRLPSTGHVFSLVMLAAGLFAGWPNLAKGEAGPVFSVALTFSMIWLSSSLLPPPRHAAFLGPIPLPSGATRVFFAVLLLVNVGGPLMFWWGWRWKRRLGGNWDVAVVRVRTRAAYS
ncbi:hypothetical protein CcaverHIS002_0107170 [Cutaneotrichosporon cavernicola]|nr:hypothetical protein CcaverHIS002_0107170 [Cutaneotrichosporon cavernicola]BEI95771.1 hypothetical protein CcaverHIS631_0107200 [Cutaneotrichosporon cavernicola]